MLLTSCGKPIYLNYQPEIFQDQEKKMNKSREMKKGFLSLAAFVLAFGIFGNQTYAQNNSNDLTGTYKIDTSRSENVGEIVENATRNTRASSNQKEDLEDKLDAPDSVTIDIRGREVTLSSSTASPVTFTADGRMQTAGNGNSTMRVRADLRNNTLKIVSLGGDTDYTITFTSIDNGRVLQVTRMITTDYLRQTVFADSFYTKTNSYANNNRSENSNGNYSDDDNDDDSSSDTGDGGYSSSDSSDRNSNKYPNDGSSSNKYPNDNTSGNYPRTTTRSGNFYVTNGMLLTGILENHITTEASQNNDKFRLTVESPSEYRGAVIEGYLSGIERSGKLSGSSKVTLNFETIRLRNGQTYDFAGVLQSITDKQGKTIKINDEGQIKGDSRTKESVKRGGIGAGLGAILGGIIGGGKGAIIGATIGGGAGAGSVAIEGKDDLELEQGSQISVLSTSPDRR